LHPADPEGALAVIQAAPGTYQIFFLKETSAGQTASAEHAAFRS